VQKRGRAWFVLSHFVLICHDNWVDAYCSVLFRIAVLVTILVTKPFPWRSNGSGLLDPDQIDPVTLVVPVFRAEGRGRPEAQRLRSSG
jgi:hypothetical protein